MKCNMQKNAPKLQTITQMMHLVPTSDNTSRCAENDLDLCLNLCARKAKTYIDEIVEKNLDITSTSTSLTLQSETILVVIISALSCFIFCYDTQCFRNFIYSLNIFMTKRTCVLPRHCWLCLGWSLHVTQINLSLSLIRDNRGSISVTLD